VVAALEQQDPQAARRKPVREGPAAGAGADDDHVVVVAHGCASCQTSAIGETQAPVAPRSFAWLRTSANSRTPSAASSLVSRFSTTKTPCRTFSVCGTSNGRAGFSGGTGPQLHVSQPVTATPRAASHSASASP